jgi:hypothetical protein
MQETYITRTPNRRVFHFDDYTAKCNYIKRQIEQALYSGNFGGYEVDTNGLCEVLPGLKVGNETAIEWTLEAIDIIEARGFELEVKLK